jgi:hypothetical protein
MTKTAEFIFILIAALIIIFVVYATGNFLTGESSLFSTATNTPQKGSGSAIAPQSGYQGGTTIQGTQSSPTSQNDNVSPYAGKVSIGWISPGYSGIFGSGYSEITLQTYGIASGEKIAITGWEVVSNKKRFAIPKGANDYAPLSPNYGDIVLDANDTVHIYSHAPPYQANFRLNKCIGYHKNFDPSIYSSCPRIDSGISHLSGECQNYLTSLSTCEIATPLPLNIAYEAACYNIASRLNYQDCYTDHKNDPDFLSDEWRVWLLSPGSPGHLNIFDQYHDKVQLLDNQKRVVDEYIY